MESDTKHRFELDTTLFKVKIDFEQGNSWIKALGETLSGPG